MNEFAFVLGQIFGTYFMVYPVLYFVWNFFIVEIGFSQYAIPDFWVGMAGFFIFNIAKNILFKRGLK